MGDERGGVGEVGEVGRHVNQVRTIGQLLCAGAFLQGVEGHIGDLEERGELREGERTARVVAMLGIAGPGETDAEAAWSGFGLGDAFAPVGDECGVGSDVGRCRGDGFERGAEGEGETGERALQIEL